MDLVYHEKQDGLLCGQHCLNNLLQGQYFSAVDLADIAQQMDQAERRHMAEQGVHTEEFQRFLEQPSVNMDDSGMFSVQVLSTALRVWDLTLVPYASTCQLAHDARHNPMSQSAYICNFKDHWLTVRKLGNQWFNLNSLLSGPELISNTYLALFLTQLQHEGYMIFVVAGNLPPSEADETLLTHPITQTLKPRLLSEIAEENREDRELKAALSASLARAGVSGQSTSTSTRGAQALNTNDIQDTDLERALQLSMLAEGAQAMGGIKLDSGGGSNHPTSPTEEENLQAAISLSLGQEMQAGTQAEAQAGTKTEVEPNLQELREKRLAFLNKNNQ